MAAFLSFWYLSLVPFLALWALMAYSSGRLQGAMARLGGVVRSREDLDVIRDAVNFNMVAALGGLVAALIYITVLLWAAHVNEENHNAVVMHGPVLAALITLANIRTRRVERQFRAMPVESSDPEIATTFQRWMKQWREPRLVLPD